MANSAQTSHTRTAFPISVAVSSQPPTYLPQSADTSFLGKDDEMGRESEVSNEGTLRVAKAAALLANTEYRCGPRVFRLPQIACQAWSLVRDALAQILASLCLNPTNLAGIRHKVSPGTGRVREIGLRSTHTQAVKYTL